MNRYSTKGNIENEYEEGGRILKNKLGIRSQRHMDRLEYEHLLKTQLHFYKVIGPNTRFTVSLICEMHKFWLGSIYKWAGKYRTVNISKRDFIWPPAIWVEKNMGEFEKNLLKKVTPCKPAPLEGISQDIAKVHAEFLLIHPFRDGNGRLARLLSSLMALQAGYPALDYGFNKRRKRQSYLKAVKKGYMRNYAVLADFMEEAIKRSERLAIS